MNNLKIDRLQLSVIGLSPDDGQRLARLIAAEMGEYPELRRRTGKVELLRAEVAGSPDSDLEHLARIIVSEIVRQMEHSLG